MSFWKGAIAPVVKHRDYLHANFYEHLVANATDMPVCDEPLWCDYDPITATELAKPTRYYVLAVHLWAGVYPYLIKEHAGGGEPDDKDIKTQMEQYINVEVPRGRDINNFIDFERGINRQIIDFMWQNDLGDKIDVRWTENQTETSAKRVGREPQFGS